MSERITVTMIQMRPCDRCSKPARRLRLYYRLRSGECFFAGAYGKNCFYKVAGQLAVSGYQPEHADTRIIYLRGGRS